MRSVHEVDSLHGPNAKAGTTNSVAGTPASKIQRIRLKLSHPPGADSEAHNETTLTKTAIVDATDPEDMTMPDYGPELGFDHHELAMQPRDLYRLLRRQIHWAEQETAHLHTAWDEIRLKRERAWQEKEGVFDDVIDGELRLFSAIVGDIGAPAVTGKNPSTSLEKLQQQQQQFKQQQEQLQAKAAEPAGAHASA